jgi:hypothetical protein
MNKEDEERDDEERGPGRFARIALRAVDIGQKLLDACQKALDAGQRTVSGLRERLGGEEDDRGERHDRKRIGRLEPATEEEAMPKKPSRLRSFLLLLAAMLIVTGIGGFVAYRILESRLAEHDAIVEGMREELDATRKENARQIDLMAKFRKESGEAKKEMRDARREADDCCGRIDACRKRVDELEGQLTRAQRHGARSGSGGVTQPRQKTGSCTIDASNPNATLKECIEKFNKP